MSLFAKLISASLEISDNVIELKSRNKVKSGSGEIVNSVLIPTEFMNKDLIEKALINYGLNTIGGDTTLKAMLEKGSIRFQNNGKTFDMVLTGNFNDDEVNSLYEGISVEYGKMVQEDTYNKVLTRIKERDLGIENEVVTDDDSIVLTISL